jgi:putative two-component system response regulator
LSPERRTRARILIVDDQVDNVVLLTRILSPTYKNVVSTTNAEETFTMIAAFQPDILLLDLHMPGLGGHEIIQRLRAVKQNDMLPVLVLTADSTKEARNRALELGANDFLTKPLDRQEVLLRVGNMLDTRMLQVGLRDHNEELEERVRERTKELEEANQYSLERLALAAEIRDDETGKHTNRVGDLAARIAGQLGWDDNGVDLVRRAAPLHDIGKIAIPDAVLLKPGKLTPAEFELMKTHTEVGARILTGGRSILLQLAEIIALTHHERWDGTGYPNATAGRHIPVSGRIVAVADVYDSLTHERPYKRAWSHEEARAEIIEQSGRHFDPRVVAAFLEVVSVLSAA